MNPFPWDQAMRVGLGLLRLPPRDFWAMTPRELAAAIAGLSAGATAQKSPTRQSFEALMHRYPDTNGQTVNG